MSKPPTIEEIQDLIDGRMESPRLEEVYGHLATDIEMAQMVQQMRRTDKALRRLGRDKLLTYDPSDQSNGSTTPSGQVTPGSQGGTQGAAHSLSQLPLPIGRDRFFRRLLRELVGTLEETVGPEEVRNLVSIVGAEIGDEFHLLYREHLAQRQLTRPQVAAACCDLKRRIGGDFSVVVQDDTKIVFENRACPFGDQVLGRPALCMTTSNVFGRLAAENLGYANVTLNETIADGAPKCRVTVHLDPDTGAEIQTGREYHQSRKPRK